MRIGGRQVFIEEKRTTARGQYFIVTVLRRSRYIFIVSQFRVHGRFSFTQ